MQYELTPAKQYKINTARSGGKDSKMSKSTKEVPVAKVRKSYSKTRGEHYKDIVIAVLITGIIAFIAGVQFANSSNAKIQAAVEAVTPVAAAQESK